MLTTSHPTSEAKAERKGELSASKASDVDVSIVKQDSRCGVEGHATRLSLSRGRDVGESWGGSSAEPDTAAGINPDHREYYEQDEPIDPAEDYWRKVDREMEIWKEEN